MIVLSPAAVKGLGAAAAHAKIWGCGRFVNKAPKGNGIGATGSKNWVWF